ncbi:MAG TPA: SAM-dependent methyltransferase, partial [Acidimicrobiales bacterium]
MKKTSVYLPEATKAALRDAAVRTGRSEADLIRFAVDRVVRTSALGADEPASPGIRRRLPTGPALVGVGVGPSDPELLTDRARHVLRGAGRVFAATTSLDAVGRAEAVVRAAEPDVAVERLVMHITPGERARRASVAAAAARVADCLDAGELVAFATLGDPHTYSAFPALGEAVRRRRPDTVIETVPGI